MLPEPFASRRVIRDDPGDAIPETPGVVHLDEMCQFVDDDVIDDGRWRHDETPGKIQAPRCAAGSPSLVRIGDPHGLNPQPHLQGEALHPLFENLPRPRPVPGAEKIPRPGSQISAQEKFAVFLAQVLSALDKPKAVLFAQEGKGLPLQEPPRPSFFLQHPGLGVLPGNPGTVLMHKGKHLAAGKCQRRTDKDPSLFRDLHGNRFSS